MDPATIGTVAAKFFGSMGNNSPAGPAVSSATGGTISGAFNVGKADWLQLAAAFAAGLAVGWLAFRRR